METELFLWTSMLALFYTSPVLTCYHEVRYGHVSNKRDNFGVYGGVSLRPLDGPLIKSQANERDTNNIQTVDNEIASLY